MSGTNALTVSPFVGLRPFGSIDSPYFFGRTLEIELLAANLRTSRVSLVYGESGVGKSSLLGAGLGSRLRKAGDGLDAESIESETENTVGIVFSMSSTDPIMELTSRLALLAGVDSNGDRSLVGAVACVLDKADRLLIVLDQFEEYLAYARSNHSDAFAQEFSHLVTARDIPVHFMLGIREDAISRLDYFGRRARDLMANPIRILPLSPDAAKEAVFGPVRVFNDASSVHYVVEPELARAVIDGSRIGMVDLGSAGRGGVPQLPHGDGDGVEAAYLQLVLRRVWDEEVASDSLTLRLQTLERLGGTAGIVRGHVDKMMTRLSARQQRTAVKVFRFLVTPSGVKVPYSASDLAALTEQDADRVADMLKRLAAEDVRIIRSLRPVSGHEPQFEIYHDRLADPILDWRARKANAIRTQAGRVGSAVLAMACLALALSFFLINGPRVTNVAVGTASILYLVYALVLWRFPALAERQMRLKQRVASWLGSALETG